MDLSHFTLHMCTPHAVKELVFWIQRNLTDSEILEFTEEWRKCPLMNKRLSEGLRHGMAKYEEMWYYPNNW